MRQSRLAFFLLAPAMLIVAATTIYPMLSSLWTSLHLFNLSRSLELGRFVWFENYTEAVLYDPEFWPVMRVTAVFVVLDVAITILCAMGLAILLRRAGVGQSILRTLIILPFAMTPALIGISWRFMLNPDFGAINRAIGLVLPFADQANYLATPGLAMAALISADVWHWAPYFAFMLMGGLAAIPPETQEAARIDGASERQVFFDVTLPQIAPVLGVAIVLKSVFALKVFDMIVTMTGGGPGVSTTTLGFHAYHLGFRTYDFGMASAVAYMLTAILFLLSLSYMRFLFRKRPA